MGDYSSQLVRETDIHFIVKEIIAFVDCIEKRKMLIGALKLPQSIGADLEQKYRLDGCHSYDYFKAVISNWINLKGSEANAMELDNALRSIEWNAAAENLKSKWFSTSRQGTLGDVDDAGLKLNKLNVVLKNLPDNITSYSRTRVVRAQVAWEQALECPELLKQFKDFPQNLYFKAALHEMHTANLSFLRRTLSKYKEYSIYKESDEQYIKVQHLIASALHELHKYEDTQSLCKLIHKTAAEKLGESHELTLDILNRLGLAESRLGNYSEQMTILDKVIARATATDQSTLVFLFNKATCLAQMEICDEALELFKSILEFELEHHSEDHMFINETRYWLARMTLEQGNSKKALEIYRTVYAELVERIGESHTKTLRCAHGIGECLLSLGEYEDAMEILTHNMELANENPSARVQCINMKYSIGKVLLNMKRYDEAVSQFRILLEERLSIYRETHPHVLVARDFLEYALQYVGCRGEALEHYETFAAEHAHTTIVEEVIHTTIVEEVIEYRVNRSPCSVV